MQGWHWLLVGGTIVGVAALLLWVWVASRRSARIKELEKLAAADRDALREMERAAAAHKDEILALKAQLSKVRAVLETSYTEKGLTADEIAERFSRL